MSERDVLAEALVTALQEAAEAEAAVWTGNKRPVVGTWGDRILEAFQRNGIVARLATTPSPEPLPREALDVDRLALALDLADADFAIGDDSNTEEYAAVVAREYAALSPDRPTPP